MLRLLALPIAQRAPMNFKTSILHKHRDVMWVEEYASVVTEWSPACFRKFVPRGPHRQLKKTSNGRSSQFNQYLSYTPIQILNQHDFLKRFWVCPPNDTFDKILKISMLVQGLLSKDRKSTRDKANINNPKVNRGCPPLTTNRTSTDCGNFTWTLDTIYSIEGLPCWGVERYMCRMARPRRMPVP